MLIMLATGFCAACTSMPFAFSAVVGVAAGAATRGGSRPGGDSWLVSGSDCARHEVATVMIADRTTQSRVVRRANRSDSYRLLTLVPDPSIEVRHLRFT